MIRDITIGQYYPADSVLHKMDPRAKLVGTLVFIISVFVFHTFPGYAVATSCANPRDCHDDVYCAAFYPNPYGGNR